MVDVLEAVLRRDRAVVLTALILLTALAWAYLVWLTLAMPAGGMSSPDSMPGMSDMPGMSMEGTAKALAPSLMSWSLGQAAAMVAMWAIMMVGMMTPSAAPMILLYAQVGRRAVATGTPFAASAWFAGGYLLAWMGFAVLATLAQWALTQFALLDASMAGASRAFGGVVLIVAGLYQFTPVKDRCLANCRAPLLFIQAHGGFRPEPLGALRIGALHGTYCVGCCWALMVLLFVGGVMNLAWIAGLAIIVLAEKVVPGGRIFSRVAGAALVIAGAYLIAVGA